MQELLVRNFGPIKEATLSGKALTLLIGPQASGKSTLARAVFFFKHLKEELRNQLDDLINHRPDRGRKSPGIGEFSKIVRNKFLEYWGSTFHLDDFSMKCTYHGEIWIEISLTNLPKKYVNPVFSPEFMAAYKSICRFVENTLSNRQMYIFEPYAEKRFKEKLDSQLNELFGFEHELLYIPAGRSLATILSNQILDLKQLDNLMNLFIQQMNRYKFYFDVPLTELISERAQHSSEKLDIEVMKQTVKIVDNITKGSYQLNKEERLYFDANRYTLLRRASSGQQESIWICYLIFMFLLEDRKVFTVIEEPEAHLFPEGQRDIVALIAMLLNRPGNEGIITTHSPYILSAFNNHLYAFNVGRTETESVKKIIPINQWLDPQQVEAFYIDKGCLDDILDPVLLLKSELVDSASNLINQDFQDLFDLDNVE